VKIAEKLIAEKSCLETSANLSLHRIIRNDLIMEGNAQARYQHAGEPRLAGEPIKPVHVAPKKTVKSWVHLLAGA
jgi:hypothetical protein